MLETQSNQSGKTIKKAIRIAIYTVVVLLLIPIFTSLLLLVPSMQKIVVDEVLDIGSEYLQANLSIENVYMKPFRTLELDGILVLDHRADTLLYAEELDLKLENYNLEMLVFEIGLSRLYNAEFNHIIYKGDSISNLNQVLERIKKEGVSESGSISLTCEDVELSQLTVRNVDWNVDKLKDELIDFKHLEIRRINGLISNIEYEESLTGVIDRLRFEESSGLLLRHLDGEVLVSDSSIQISSMNLVTNRSVLQGEYVMSFDEYSDFKDFNRSVELQATLKNSRIDFRDVGYFSPPVKNLFGRVEFTGHAKGTINNLLVDIDSLEFGNESELKGSVALRGLPSVDDLLFQSNIDRLFVTPLDFEQLTIPTGRGQSRRISIPDEAQAIHFAEYNGSVNGRVKDFMVVGRLKTNLGAIATDMNLRTGGDFTYAGKIASNDFLISQLMEGEMFGSIGFDLEINGSRSRPDSLDIEAIGKLAYADVNGYRYHGIDLNTRWNNKVLDTRLDIDDPNLKSNLVLNLNLRTNVARTQINGSVSRALLDKLNFPVDSSTSIASQIEVDFHGNKIKNLSGFLRLTELHYVSGNRQLSLDSLVFKEFLVKGKRRVAIETDVANIELMGQTTLMDLPYAFKEVGSRFAPDLFAFSVPDTTNKFQVFDIRIDVKDEKSFIEFLHPKLRLYDPLKISGNLNMMTNSFTLTSDTVDWALDELRARRSTIHVLPIGDSLFANIQSARIDFSKDYFLENIKLDAALFNDSLLTSITWENKTEQGDSGQITLMSFNSDEFTYNSVLEDLNLQIAGVDWHSTSTASLSLDTSHLSISNFQLRSKNGAITCDGEVSRGAADHLLFEVENLDLSYLSNFGLVENDIQGVLNAKVDLFEASDALSANARIEADSLIIDGLEVGKIKGSSIYNHEEKNLKLDVDLYYQGDRNVKLYGDIYPRRNEDQLDLRLQVDKFRLTLLEPFIERQLSDMSGEVNGTIDLTGKLKKMYLNGSLSMTEFVGKVGYLKTKYSIPKGDIIFEDDFIGMDAVEGNDEKESKGFLTATVFHENFSNFNYDIYIDADNFTALNTTSADNPSYYGTANITGDVSISGYQGQMDIEVIAKTNKKTKLSIPLDDGGDVSELDYIRFIQPRSGVIEKDSRYDALASELRGLSLNFQLEVTDDAELQIIFDEKIGDVVKVKGVGDILMEINNRGTFAMYGTYQISQGDYLFTLQNVINKRFNVRPGSRIVWNGSPYDAQVDLAAIYGLKASPFPITASVGDTSEVYKKRMPVDVYLNMNGPLLEPLITFDIDIPSLPESDIANQLLDPSVTSEQDMNEQVFALLLANTFFNSQDGIGGFKTGQRTTYEMVSNQFSNWLSQYFDNVDIGVNYRPGDEDQQLGTQTEVEISTELFNERVLVEVNGSVQGQDGTSTDGRNVAGEFNVEYKINEEGTFRARVYNEANNYNPVNLNQSPYTQGVGLFYRKEFGKIGDLFRSKNKED